MKQRHPALTGPRYGGLRRIPRRAYVQPRHGGGRLVPPATHDLGGDRTIVVASNEERDLPPARVDATLGDRERGSSGAPRSDRCSATSMISDTGAFGRPGRALPPGRRDVSTGAAIRQRAIRKRSATPKRSGPTAHGPLSLIEALIRAACVIDELLILLRRQAVHTVVDRVDLIAAVVDLVVEVWPGTRTRTADEPEYLAAFDASGPA